MLRITLLDQFDDPARCRLAGLPGAAHRLAPDRIAVHVVAERPAVAIIVGFDKDDGKADRLACPRPDPDLLAIIFAQLRLGRGGGILLDRDGDADPLHPRRTHLRPQCREEGADPRPARRRVGLIERAHPFEHRELIAQPDVDLHRDAGRLLILLRLVVKETGDRRREGRCQDAEPDEADRKGHQPICPERRAHYTYPDDCCRSSAPLCHK